MSDIDVSRLPLEYWLCAIFLVVVCAFAVRQRRELWAPPFIAVLGTIAAWYMVEPLYFEGFFSDFTYTAGSTAYQCLLIFFIAFTIATPGGGKWIRPRDPSASASPPPSLHPQKKGPALFVLLVFLLGFRV